MANGLDQIQVTSLIVNLSILVVSIIVCAILIHKIKFEDNNYRLLFILYTLYWIAPMLLREYTSQMHTAMANAEWTTGSLMWLPVTVYGIIGLFWKPLNDLMSHKLKNRKTVIYISLVIQAVGAIPMVICPCLATNIIQSITVGIGASGIAVFNLMFNEQYAKKKVFLTVSLLSLPPLLAEFFSSVLQCVVTSFLPSKTTIDDNPVLYINIVKYMWVLGLVFIVAAAILGIFVKEKRALLYQDNQYKEPINNKWDGWVIVLLLFAASVTSFIKFCTCGGTAITQLEYIGKKNPIPSWNVNTNAFQGYLSVVFTVGQMASNIITGLFLVRKVNKLALFGIASGIWVVYVATSASILNVYAHIALMILNGFAFGMIYNLIVGITMNKYFTKTNRITPITLYNTGLSIGIVSSQFFNTFLKQDVFAKIKVWDEAKGKWVWDWKLSWNDFVTRNWIVSGVVLGMIVLMFLALLGYYLINKNHPPQRIKVNKVKNWQDMDD